MKHLVVTFSNIRWPFLKPACFILLFGLHPASGCGQTASSDLLSLDACLSVAYSQNEVMKLAGLERDYFVQQKKASYEIPKTSLIYTQGQFNSIYPYDNIFSISQVVPFPTYFKAQAELGKSQIKGAEYKMEGAKAELAYKVKEVFYTLQHLIQESELLRKEDSIYEAFLKVAEKEIASSAENELEEATTITKAHLIQNSYNRILEEVIENRIKLQYLLRAENLPQVKVLPEKERVLRPDTLNSSVWAQPNLLYLKEQIEISKQLKMAERSKAIPDIHLSYFNQSIYGPANIYGDNYFLTTSDRLQGFQLGLIFPLYFGPQKAKIKSGQVSENMARERLSMMQKDMEGQFKQAVNRYLLNKKNLEYYEEHILKNSRKMVVKAHEAFDHKQINYIEYLALIDQSFQNARDYLHMVLANNLAVIQIDYFLYKGSD